MMTRWHLNAAYMQTCMAVETHMVTYSMLVLITRTHVQTPYTFQKVHICSYACNNWSVCAMDVPCMQVTKDVGLDRLN